jgi:hypothetical protein
MHAIQLRGGRGRYSAGTRGSFSRPDRRKLSRRDSYFVATTRAPRFGNFLSILANIEIWLAETEPCEISGSFGLMPGNMRAHGRSRLRRSGPRERAGKRVRLALPGGERLGQSEMSHECKNRSGNCEFAGDLSGGRLFFSKSERRSR